MTTTSTEFEKEDQPVPWYLIAIIPFYIVGIMVLVLLLPTGDWTWLEGWLFIITFAINMGISYFYINLKNPRLIRNRAKRRKVGITEETKSSASSDRFIVPLMAIGFIGMFVIVVIDHNQQISSIPLVVTIIGLLIFHFGLIIMNRAQLENAYASKILDINKGQQLIDTGLYSWVRHPLYAGGNLMALGIPLALGSWIAILPAIFTGLVLVFRIRFEEEMLVNGMEGYSEYQQRVKYKLIPKVY